MIIPGVLSALLLALDIALFFAVNRRRSSQDNIIDKLKQERDTLERDRNFLQGRLNAAISELSTLGLFFNKNAEQQNNAVAEIREGSVSEENTWNFKSCCDSLCGSMLTTLKKVAFSGEKFSVSYIADAKSLRDSLRRPKNSSIYMIGYADDSEGRPSVFYPNPIPKKYYSRVLFNKKQHRFAFLKDAKEILDKFDLKEGSEDKYSQYIGLPVFCSGNKMIGLIELVAFKGSQIIDPYGQTPDDVIEHFFRPYSHLFLLSNKLEKVILALQKAKKRENFEKPKSHNDSDQAPKS